MSRTAFFFFSGRSEVFLCMLPQCTRQPVLSLSLFVSLSLSLSHSLCVFRLFFVLLVHLFWLSPGEKGRSNCLRISPGRNAVARFASGEVQSY